MNRIHGNCFQNQGRERHCCDKFSTAMPSAGRIPGKTTDMAVEFEKMDGMIWQPIFTLPKNEKKLFASLTANGIAAYLPMRRHFNVHPVVSKGKSYCYKRELRVPMFPGYLFARIQPETRSELNRNRSVIRILPVSETEENTLLSELRMIRELEKISEDKNFDITNGLVKGIKVRFTEGEFNGWEGIVLDTPKPDGFAYIHVTSVNASIKIRYPAAWCRIVDEVKA